MTTSKIMPLGGVPTLFVNDSPIPGIAYMNYFTEKNRYSDFAGAGFFSRYRQTLLKEITL